MGYRQAKEWPLRRLLATTVVALMFLVAGCSGEAVLPEWNFVVTLATKDGPIEKTTFTKRPVHVTITYDKQTLFDDNVRYFPLKLYERKYQTKPITIHANAEQSGYKLMCWIIDVSNLKKVDTDGPGSLVDCNFKTDE